MAAPRLVVLRALGLGDLLTAVPALRALATAFPDHHRILATPAGLAGLVDLVGGVDEVVDVDLRRGGGPAPTAALDERVRTRLAGADVAVNLHGRGPESSRLLAEGRPRRVVAFAHPEVPETAGAPAWDHEEHEVVRWCRLLSAAGIDADPADLDVAVPPALRPGDAAGASLLHPGAASPSRRWPAARWADLARRETAAGRRVVVTAGPGERALADAVVAAAGLPAEARREPADVVALAGLVAAAELVVCGDTGVAHLATALGTPSVVLFGPVPPWRWGPPSRDGRHRALYRGADGRPAGGDLHGDGAGDLHGDGAGDPHGDVADGDLLRITVDDVDAALGDLRAAGADER